MILKSKKGDRIIHLVAYLSNDGWLNDIAFPTDITYHLLYLNVKLQGKNQLVKKFEHIYSFEKKLKPL